MRWICSWVERLSTSALFSIRDQSGRRAAANSDHQSAIASPSNTGIALRITKITHSICRRPEKYDIDISLKFNQTDADGGKSQGQTGLTALATIGDICHAVQALVCQGG
jgi:hypothetical protein